MTPLMLATKHGKKNIAQALLVAGAEVDVTNNEGFTAEFFFAWSQQHEDILQLLQQHSSKQD